MKLSNLRFNLPPDLIADYPVDVRDESRLMVLHRNTGKIEHRTFKDLPEYFVEGDLIVLNDTAVYSALLLGSKEKTGTQVTVMLLRELNSEHRLWDAFVDPARKIRVGNKLFFGDGELVSEVLDNTTSRGRTLKFLFDGTPSDLQRIIKRLGRAPIPKELGRDPMPEDKERYQTIYAQHLGAVVAPCAGLHFTRHLLKRLELKGVRTASVTLHLGLGNFRKIEVEDTRKYRPDAEFMNTSMELSESVNKTHQKGRQVCAVGSSVVRALESSVSIGSNIKPYSGWTNLYISPVYDLKVCTSLITNFHVNSSLQFMNAMAFAGKDLLLEAYNLAIRERYRFFIYGDAMLII